MVNPAFFAVVGVLIAFAVAQTRGASVMLIAQMNGNGQQPAFADIFPGFADAAEYSFSCPSVLSTEKKPPLEKEDFAFKAPSDFSGKLRVRAKLRYRKVDQFLLNFLFGEDTKVTSPITDMSEDEAVIAVVPET